MTAQTPDFALGSKDNIRLKPKASAASAAPPAAAATANGSKPGNAWLLAGDDMLDEELLDDEELLTEEDKQRPAGQERQRQLPHTACDRSLCGCVGLTTCTTCNANA